MLQHYFNKTFCTTAFVRYIKCLPVVKIPVEVCKCKIPYNAIFQFVFYLHDKKIN